MVQAPRKWPPRVFAVYLVTTVIGGVILILFLILTGLYYWMNAQVALPADPRHIAPRNTTGWIAIRATDLTAVPPEIRRVLASGIPEQVKRLIQRGDSASGGPVLIVASTFPGKDGPGLALSVSLSRYPGQFWLVRRDLERRCEKGTLPMSLNYVDRRAVFVGTPEQSPLPVLCLARCTLFRSSDPEVLKDMIGGLQAEGPGWPRAPLPNADFMGNADRWQELPWPGFLSPEAGAGWEKFSTDFVAAFPVLSRTAIEFGGSFRDRKTADVRFRFKASDSEEGAAVAARLAAWLAKNGPGVGATHPEAKSEKDGVISGKLTIEF